MSSSTHGRWAGRFLAIAGALFVSFNLLVASGQRGGETFFANGLLAFTMLGAAVAAICAGCAGLAAAARSDRSLTVITSIVVGAGVVLWVASEILFPH